MERETLYEALEKEFGATFLDELVPGMLHNFANPLNGIMGRSRLLQQRLEESVEQLQRTHPDVYGEMKGHFDKVASDTNLIIRETDRFYEMFRNVTRKFFALSSKSDQRVNLAHLIEEEVRFADCYLDFKHHVNRTLSLQPGLPDVPGILAHYSIGFSALIRYAMKIMRDCPEKEIRILLDREDAAVRLNVFFTGDVSRDRVENILKCLDARPEGRHVPGDDDGLLVLCLALFREHGARCRVAAEAGQVRVEIRMPVHPGEGEGAHRKNLQRDPHAR